MESAAQFERCRGAFLPVFSRLSFLLTVLILFCALAAHAQEPQIAVGNIEGDDLTVSSGASSVNLSSASAASAPIANGGVVTVHSGQARLMLVSGGEIDICGPAKLTLLQSGDATTVALDLGRVRVQLPASTNLRIFTPAIVATPLDINGAPRDITLSLETDDSLCVRAATGALLLESQFSSEKIVVPQAGQFFFAQGHLVPVARTDMQCECVLKEARIAPPATPWPSVGLTAPPETADSKPPAEPKKPADDQPSTEVEYSILANPNASHPVAAQPKNTTPAPPDSPVYQIVMPPLTFSASSPAPPPLPAADMILLIRTAEVEPDFEFTGHVNPPPLDDNSKTPAPEKHAHGHQPKPAGERPGFWARVKHFLVGSSS
jgi:hypothetical protein